MCCQRAGLHQGAREGGPGEAGQEGGEFSPVDADDFTITLSALLDGFAVQIALDDPAVPPQRTYDLAMRFAAGQLGFDWKPAPAGRRTRTRAS